MKKKFVFLLIFLLIFGLIGCSEKESSQGKPGELILNENAFGVKVYVRNMTSEKVTFMVVPYGGEFEDGGQAEMDGPGGLFGTFGMVPGNKKGEKVELDGSFTLYAHDESGPSVVIQVKGTYVIDDLKNNTATMHYYLYEDGQFIKSDRATVYK